MYLPLLTWECIKQLRQDVEYIPESYRTEKIIYKNVNWIFKKNNDYLKHGGSYYKGQKCISVEKLNVKHSNKKNTLFYIE